MKKTPLFLAVFTFGITAFSQIPNYVPSNGLVGWWPFNGNANDESGNGNNGTVNGATLTADRNGSLNCAYYLPNLNDNISVTCAASPYTGNSLTISFWMQFPQQYNYSSIFMVKNGVAWSNGFSISVDQNNGAYGVNNYQVAFIVGSTPCSFITNQSELGIWSNIVGVYNGTEIKLYLNNELKTTVTFSGNISSPDGNLVFSDWDNPSTPAVTNRNIDDIGIWNSVLTECEIQDLYYAQLNFANSTINAGPDQFICFGDSIALLASGGFNYQWDNNVIDGQYFIPTSNNQYVVQGEDSIGCFGYDTLFVTVLSNNSISAGLDQSICAGDNVTLNGAQDTLGCTGTDTVVVTVLENATSTLTETALDSYTLNGQTYTQSGTYTQTLTAANGCDSTITLNLTLNFTGMDELGAGVKKLVKITDLNGKIIPRRKNTLMLFIYEDGTVERVVEMEE